MSLLPDLSREDIFRLAACAEKRSEHPLGRAVVRCWGEEAPGELPQPEEFRMIPGRGVTALAEGRRVAAGNPELLAQEGIPLSPAALEQADAFLKEGCTVIWLGVDGRAAGFLALADTLREEAAAAIAGVREAGVEPVLLTGDNENAARHIAAQLGLQEVRSGCLPEDKLQWIDQSQKAGRKVCMMGDGVNDAPALKRAWVGIAMGGVGSDIAVDAADIALVSDDIRELPHLLRLSKRMMKVIKCNLTFSMTLNFLAIALAISGWLNPVVGALVHNAGSVLVIINSAFLLSWKGKRRS